MSYVKVNISVEVMRRDKEGNIIEHYRENPDGSITVMSHGNDGK